MPILSWTAGGTAARDIGRAPVGGRLPAPALENDLQGRKMKDRGCDERFLALSVRALLIYGHFLWLPGHAGNSPHLQKMATDADDDGFILVTGRKAGRKKQWKQPHTYYNNESVDTEQLSLKIESLIQELRKSQFYSDLTSKSAMFPS